MDAMERTTAVSYEYEGAKDTVTSECTVEHTLPDYLPEIRKLLRVSARPIGTGRYLGDGRAEFSGIVAFTVVYTDEEGAPAALTLNGDYAVSLPLGEGEAAAPLMDTEVESTVCRLSGPRRIALRAGLRHTPRLPLTRPLPTPDTEGCERLTRRMTGRSTLLAESGELTFGDAIAVTGVAPDAVHPLFCEGDLLIEECRPKEGSISVRGTVGVRVLATQEGGRPLPLSVRIPLTAEIDCEGACATDMCLPRSTVTAITARVTGDGDGGCRIEIDGAAEYRVQLLRNEVHCPTVGAYSPTCRSEVKKMPLTLEAVAGAASGHYTVSGNTTVGEEPAALILDTSATASVRKVTCEDGHPVVLGEMAVCLLLAGTPDEEGHIPYHAEEYRFPYRVSLPITLAEGALRYECRCEAHEAHSRIEEGGYATEVELSVTLAAFREEGAAIVSEVTLYPEEAYPAREGSITVVYPEADDTLFSLAERYHTTAAALSDANHLPFEGNEEAALPTSLDGVAYLIVD